MAGTSCYVVLLVTHLAGNAEGLNACGNGVEHLGRRFGKVGDRCLARHRVDGRFLWANALKRREPGGNVLLAGVVDELALILAGQKDRLDNNVTVKACERLDLVLDVVGANRLVEQLNKRRVDGIELKNVVVDHHERVVHFGAVGARAVGEHGDLGVWGKLVAQRDGAGGAAVGSPLPAKVITSGSSPSAAISRSFASSASSTTAAVLYGSWQGRSALRPFSQ